MAEKKKEGGGRDWDFVVKFGLVGGYVGKTCLLGRFVDDDFDLVHCSSQPRTNGIA